MAFARATLCRRTIPSTFAPEILHMLLYGFIVRPQRLCPHFRNHFPWVVNLISHLTTAKFTSKNICVEPVVRSDSADVAALTTSQLPVAAGRMCYRLAWQP